MNTFTSISFIANCRNQEEVDELWEKLSEGGEAQQRGWLRDKYGISWQIVPEVLEELLNDEEPSGSERVVKALMQMRKLDIETLKRAYQRL